MKKEVCVKVYDLSIDLDGPLNEVKETIDDLIQRYGDKFSRLHLRHEQEDYGDSYYYYLYGYRPQTDAELKIEQDRLALYEQREREQFERLKEKFG